MSDGVHKRLDLAVIATGRLPVHLRNAGKSRSICENGAYRSGGGDGSRDVTARWRVGRDLCADGWLRCVGCQGDDALFGVDELRVHVAVGQVQQQKKRLFTRSSHADARHPAARGVSGATDRCRAQRGAPLRCGWRGVG